MIEFDRLGLVWYGIDGIWYSMVRYGMVWYRRNGMVWYGTIRFGMVWYCMVRYGNLGVYSHVKAAI